MFPKWAGGGGNELLAGPEGARMEGCSSRLGPVGTFDGRGGVAAADLSTSIRSAFVLLPFSAPPLTLEGTGLLVSGLIRLTTSGRGILAHWLDSRIYTLYMVTYLSIAAFIELAEPDFSCDAGAAPLT